MPNKYPRARGAEESCELVTRGSQYLTPKHDHSKAFDRADPAYAYMRARDVKTKKMLVESIRPIGSPRLRIFSTVTFPEGKKRWAARKHAAPEPRDGLEKWNTP